MSWEKPSKNPMTFGVFGEKSVDEEKSTRNAMGKNHQLVN